MNKNQPPVPARNFTRLPDDLDGLLSAFLHSEMPDPWPAWKVPASSISRPLPLARSRPRLGSRFALAATVALCLAGSLSLAVFFPSLAPTQRETNPNDLIGPKHKDFKPVFTPDGKKAEYREERTGKTITIEVRLVPPPEEEE
jgi:hypothetical protein